MLGEEGAKTKLREVKKTWVEGGNDLLLHANGNYRWLVSVTPISMSNFPIFFFLLVCFLCDGSTALVTFPRVPA